jgi:hypothetical protein
MGVKLKALHHGTHRSASLNETFFFTSGYQTAIGESLSNISVKEAILLRDVENCLLALMNRVDQAPPLLRIHSLRD